jgi:hypothetical protein
MLFKLHLRGSESSWHTMDGTEEPDESITHVRVCGGAGWVTTGSTRNSDAAKSAAPVSLSVMRQESCAIVLCAKEVQHDTSECTHCKSAHAHS